MANMEVTDRTQYDRHDLRASGEGIRRGTARGATVYTVLALILGVILSVAVVETVGGMLQWLVLGVIVLTVVGIIIAVNPARRVAG